MHFVWFGKADTVKIEGELQKSWAIPQAMTRIECGGDNLFYYSYTLPSNAFLEYRFLVDNIQAIDSKNPQVSQGFDLSDRNFFSMPDFKELPAIKPRYGINKGTIVQWLFRTEHKPFTNQPIKVYLPFKVDGFAFYGNSKGRGLFNSTYSLLWRLNHSPKWRFDNLLIKFVL